eukprot:1680258-Pyramimonas_sp.AAC.1
MSTALTKSVPSFTKSVTFGHSPAVEAAFVRPPVRRDRRPKSRPISTERTKRVKWCTFTKSETFGHSQAIEAMFVFRSVRDGSARRTFSRQQSAQKWEEDGRWPANLRGVQVRTSGPIAGGER